MKKAAVHRFLEVAAIQNPVPTSEGISRRPVRLQTLPVAQWIIAVALVVIATSLVTREGSNRSGEAAFAQAVTSGGARGVFAFSGQLSKNTYGVYMVDVDAMTTWVYEYLPQKGCLRLAAGRSWRYDRYLENYNLCGVPPGDVEQMIEDQRRFRERSSESQMP